jgi:hypothetical protein
VPGEDARRARLVEDPAQRLSDTGWSKEAELVFLREGARAKHLPVDAARAYR